MKFTLSWLKEHLEPTRRSTQICDRLTMLGLEVEGVDDRGADAAPLQRRATSSRRAQHPNADRLRVCTVDTGDGVVEVVCGAPNARTGMKGVFAPVGAIIPGTGEVLKTGDDPRRRQQRHAVLGARAGARRRP